MASTAGSPMSVWRRGRLVSTHDGGRMSERPTILEARDLVVSLGGRRRSLFRPARAPVRAVAGVSLALRQGETLGLVGESGCGKTTLGRTLLGIQREAAGEIRLDGAVVSGLAPALARARRRAIQYVHQDAAAALEDRKSTRLNSSH